VVLSLRHNRAMPLAVLRVASMLAASGDEAVRGLVLLSYPLHRPGHSEDQRNEHWPDIHCPVLFLSGDADPVAKVDLLRKAISVLDDAHLVVYRRVTASHRCSTMPSTRSPLSSSG
jgi:predicted alpha/beta-hydrolase family hydrolase